MEDPLLEQDILAINDHQKIQLAEKHRELGKNAFQSKDTENAFVHFTKAIKYLILINPKTASEEILIQKAALLPLLQNNTASCHMKKGNWESVIDLCDSVLQNEPENVKALYRRGTALMEIQEYEKSAADLYAAQAIELGNVAVKTKLEVLNGRLSKFNQKEAQAMKKLFS